MSKKQNIAEEQEPEFEPGTKEETSQVVTIRESACTVILPMQN